MKELEEKIKDIEAQLIEQDHRPVHIITRYLKARNELPENDPRREAAFKALLWRVFFSPGSVAATGGLVALITLAILVWQNYLIKEQNGFLKEEITLSQISRETEIVYSNYDTYPPARKSIAALELIRLNQAIDPEKTVKLNGALLAGTNFSEATIHGVDFSGADLRGASFNSSDLLEVNFTGADLSIYEVEENGSRNIYYADFRDSNIHNSTFERNNLYHTDFSYSDFSGTKFSGIGVGESSGVIIGDTKIRELPKPLILNASGLTAQSRKALESQYLSIFDQEHLELFIESIKEIQSLPDFLENGVMVKRNHIFYQSRLDEYLERSKVSTEKKNSEQKIQSDRRSNR